MVVILTHLFLFLTVDYSVTNKEFTFASKRELPFYFCSASDGTNVVKVFNDAIVAAAKCKANPPDDFLEDVLDLLGESDK